MEKKTKAISKRKEKRELVFAGASSLMGVDPKKLSATEVVAHKARILASKALGIPPNTVVMMGGNVYVDNHGRKSKLADYAPKAQFEYEYVQIAKDDNEKAIVKCRIMKLREKPNEFGNLIADALCGWVIGECSPATTRMGTLKGYQNHLAQTRAENRAFEAAFGVRFRKDLYEGIGRELGIAPDAVDTESPEVNIALQAGNTSAEEAVPMKKETVAFDAYKNAMKVFHQKETAKELELFRQQIRRSTHLTIDQMNKFYSLIDEKLAKM